MEGASSDHHSSAKARPTSYPNIFQGAHGDRYDYGLTDSFSELLPRFESGDLLFWDADWVARLGISTFTCSSRLDFKGTKSD